MIFEDLEPFLVLFDLQAELVDQPDFLSDLGSGS